MKGIVFYLAIPAGISAIIGLIWVISYLAYSQNIQTTLRLFLYSFIGGWLGGIVGCFIGYLVGAIISEEAKGSIFIGSEGFSRFFWILIFWTIGIVVGAVLGGLIFIRIYS